MLFPGTADGIDGARLHRRRAVGLHRPRRGAGDEDRRQDRPPPRPRRHGGEHDQHVRQPDGPVRPVPQPQVRPDHAGGLLPPAGRLRRARSRRPAVRPRPGGREARGRADRPKRPSCASGEQDSTRSVEEGRRARSWPTSTRRSPRPTKPAANAARVRLPQRASRRSRIASKWVQVDLGQSVALDRSRPVRLPRRLQRHRRRLRLPGALQGRAVRRCRLPDRASRSSPTTRRPTCRTPAWRRRRIRRTAATGRYVRVTATKLAPRQNDFIFALAELEVFDAAGQERRRRRGGDGARLDRGARPLAEVEPDRRLSPPARPWPAIVAKLTKERERTARTRRSTPTRAKAMAERRGGRWPASRRELAKLPPAARGLRRHRPHGGGARSAAPGPTAASRGRSTSCRAAT